jgi:predicted DNA-binding ribbon-helix-helix protein
VVEIAFSSAGAIPKKRSINIAGHKTSITLEDAFWDALKKIAVRHNVSVAGLVAAVDKARGEATLSAALRVFILENQTREKREILPS